MQNIETPQPATHDLMKNLLDEVGAGRAHHGDTLRDGPFFAEIVLNAEGEVRTVSSRPSDAIAWPSASARRSSPGEDVLDEAGQVEQPNEEQAEQMVEEFREFIDHINRDFAL